jgi:hypothetical protein
MLALAMAKLISTTIHSWSHAHAFLMPSYFRQVIFYKWNCHANTMTSGRLDGVFAIEWPNKNVPKLVGIIMHPAHNYPTLNQAWGWKNFTISYRSWNIIEPQNSHLGKIHGGLFAHLTITLQKLYKLSIYGQLHIFLPRGFKILYCWRSSDINRT